MVSYRLVFCRILLYHIVLYPILSYRTEPYCMVLCGILSYRSVSHCTASHHIALYHIFPPSAGSRQVTDEAMKRACYVTRFLFADHSRVRQSYYARSGRVAVIAANEGVTTIPEHRWLGPSWNARARGLGATDNAPVSTCGEEHMLCWR